MEMWVLAFYVATVAPCLVGTMVLRHRLLAVERRIDQSDFDHQLFDRRDFTKVERRGVITLLLMTIMFMTIPLLADSLGHALYITTIVGTFIGAIAFFAFALGVIFDEPLEGVMFFALGLILLAVLVSLFNHPDFIELFK